MRCPLLLLAASVVLGGMTHISPELLRHEPLVATSSDSMHNCSSVLCSIEGHVPRRHFANTHTCPGASFEGSTTQTCATDVLEDGLAPEHGSKQPHVLALNTAYSSPKFGGLHATSILGRAITYLTHYVRAAQHTEHTHHSTYTSAVSSPCHCLHHPRVKPLPQSHLLLQYTLPCTCYAGPRRGEGDAEHRYDPHADHLLSIAAAVRRRDRRHAPQHPTLRSSCMLGEEQSTQVSELSDIGMQPLTAQVQQL